MRLLQTALVMGLGLLTLAMYFFARGSWAALQWAFYDWAAVVVAAAWVLGLVYLSQHHWRGLIRRRRDRLARGTLLLSLLVTFTLTLWTGPTGPLGRWLLEYALLPAASSLFAVVGVVLTYRGLWLLHRRRDPLAWAFGVGVVLFLLMDVARFVTGYDGLAQALRAFQRWLVVPALRGLLLALALGLIATGWRLLMGVDRPYEDE